MNASFASCASEAVRIGVIARVSDETGVAKTIANAISPLPIDNRQITRSISSRPVNYQNTKSKETVSANPGLRIFTRLKYGFRFSGMPPSCCCIYTGLSFYLPGVLPKRRGTYVQGLNYGVDYAFSGRPS